MAGVPGKSAREDARNRRFELAAAIILGLAGIAASWSSYQAARWSGVQAADYSRAGAARVEATRLSSEADALRAIDVGVFMSWVDAYASGEEEVEAFYRERFRPEFNPAFEAWLASEPLVNPEAVPTPFGHPEYRIAQREQSMEMAQRADELFRSGEVANEYSDGFLAGIAHHFESAAVQGSLLGIASVILVLGFWTIATLPRI